MSVDIIYEKQFIDLKNGRYFPLVLIGSSNLWETINGKERRVRDWNFFHVRPCFKSVMPTADQMLSAVDVIRECLINKHEGYNDKAFSYYSSIYVGSKGSNSPFSSFKGVFKSGIKYALSIEQFIHAGYNIHFDVTRYLSKDSKLSDYGINDESFSFTPSSTDDLIGFLSKYEKAIFDGVLNVNSYMPRDVQEFKTRIRYPNYPKQTRKKVLKQANDFYVVMNKDGRVFYSCSKRGYRYSMDETCGKKFLKESDAKRKARFLNERFFEKSFKAVPIHTETPQYFY